MDELSYTEQIDQIISELSGWKAETLTAIRSSVCGASDLIEETVKWKTPSRPAGLPVWVYGVNICLAEVWKDKIVLIFVNGAELPDPDNLFNARLKSRTDRAIEFREGDQVKGRQIAQLVQEAVVFNASK